MFGDGSADYVIRTEAIVRQYEFERGIRQVRGQSFLHGMLFGIALAMFRRAIRRERRS